ncbi:MAG: hypothetical protein D6736_00360 [Nitrospinota bacterium]|nr:MAG: hypothetical protein D6736_00360 [Nitrospinota bacterium]
MLPLQSELRRFIDLLQSRWGDDLVGVILLDTCPAPREGKRLELLVIKRTFPLNHLARHQEITGMMNELSPGFVNQIAVFPVTPAEIPTGKQGTTSALRGTILYDAWGTLFSLY